jgi:hypothetical protein
MSIEAVIGKAVLKFLAGSVVPVVGNLVLSAFGIDKNGESSTVRNQDRPGIELGDYVLHSAIGLLADDTVQSTGSAYGELIRALLHEVHGSVEADTAVIISVPGSKFSLGRWRHCKDPFSNGTNGFDVMLYDEAPADGVVIQCIYGPLNAGTGKAMAYCVTSVAEHATTQTRV